MFTYKNKITGAVINTHGKVTGENWELVKADKKRNQKKEEEPKNDENKETKEEREEDQE